MMTIHGPVILDLNTQRDLFTPEGVLPVDGVEKFPDLLKRAFTWAQRQQIPVVSTRLRDVAAPGQRGMGRIVCHPGGAGSGYEKLPSTLLRRRQEMPLDCGTSLPVEGFKITQQYIFDLVSLNPFECPRLDRLLSESNAGVWILVGGPLEATLRTCVLGLLQRRHKVAVVSDLLGMWDPYEGDMALRQIESKNIEWLTVAQMMEKYGPRPIRRPTPAPARVNAAARATARSAATTGRKNHVPQAKNGSSRNGAKMPKREFKLT